MLRLARHEATSPNVASLYPWQSQPSLPSRGVLIGHNLFSGTAHYYDPWDYYRAGLLSNPNMLVAGEVGAGKSAAVKTFIFRQVGAHGRWAAILDPKGEYQGLAAALEMPVIRLEPGGSVRLNPLDVIEVEDREVIRRRAETLSHVASVILRREVSSEERAAVEGAVQGLHEMTRPELADVISRLLAPSSETATELVTTQDRLAEAARPVALALRRLTGHGDLAGMFDGQTTLRMDLTGRGVVFDLSAVFETSAQPLVMLLTASWMREVLSAPGGPRRMLVLDEAWAILEDLATARWLQASFKLSRGSVKRAAVSNILVVHRLSDLRSQAADGTAAMKVASGLLADTGTRVIFRQAASEVADAMHLLGLSAPQAEMLTKLPRGRALWRIGSLAALVHHVVGGHEKAMTDTDSRMTE